MPSYEFECKKCLLTFTELLPAGTQEAKCRKCGSKAKKLVSAPAVHFKGGGFYSSKQHKKTETETKKKDCPKGCKDCPLKKKSD